MLLIIISFITVNDTGKLLHSHNIFPYIFLLVVYTNVF